ncbi:MAG TPA: hypothetical protein VMU34_02285 [Mycobacterium sp.]|nr:hypothetical protein [Mycobacterium sp.]
MINGDGLIKKLPLPLNGGQRIVAGGKRNGMITLVTRASQAGDAVKLGAIKVGTLACACVRGIAAKSCGGTLRNKDGSLATDCTPQFTKGDSLCAGTGKACAFVHGPGLSATGVIGCNGLAGTDLTFTQDAGGMPLPPPGTPPIGAGPPIITLSGSGGPGSFVLINSSAIGQAQTTSFSPKPNVCDAHSTVGTVPPDFGPDKIYCTDDDPNGCVGGSSPGAACDSDADCPGSGTCVHARGAVQSLPVVSGTATGEVFNVKSPGSNFGPFSITGGPFGCDLLLAPTPVITGAGLAGAFVALNQPQLGDIIVTNLQFSQ